VLAREIVPPHSRSWLPRPDEPQEKLWRKKNVTSIEAQDMTSILYRKLLENTLITAYDPAEVLQLNKKHHPMTMELSGTSLDTYALSTRVTYRLLRRSKVFHLPSSPIWPAVDFQLACLPQACQVPRIESRTTASAAQRAEATACSSKPIPRTEYAPQK